MIGALRKSALAGPAIALAVLFIASAIWKPDLFLAPENLRNIINQNASVGILAVGMTLVILAGGIDLSVGSMMALLGVVAMKAMNDRGGDGAVWVAAAISLGFGATLGVVNGVLITAGRMAPFIATLAGLVAFRSIALGMADGGEIRAAVAGYRFLGQEGIALTFLRDGGGRPLVLQWPIFLFILVACAVGWLIQSTPFGRHTVAVGANEQAARYSAIPVDRVKIATYAILGLCAGLATLCGTSRTESVTSGNFGLYRELDAIAAVVIGGARLSGGYARVTGTVIGVLMLGIIDNILVTSGVSTYWQGCVKGVIILVAVLIQRGRAAGG
ncbi:MAG: ABC transporter permease [Fimbriimonadaceae bacterium]|nr:ABC transporter permease [Fimbriimonadaceae bacterium]